MCHQNKLPQCDIQEVSDEKMLCFVQQEDGGSFQQKYSIEYL